MRETERSIRELGLHNSIIQQCLTAGEKYQQSWLEIVEIMVPILVQENQSLFNRHLDHLRHCPAPDRLIEVDVVRERQVIAAQLQAYDRVCQTHAEFHRKVKRLAKLLAEGKWFDPEPPAEPYGFEGEGDRK